MPVSVASRVHRTLRRLPRFDSSFSEEELRVLRAHAEVTNDETIIGFYRNLSPAPDLIVTDQALLIIARTSVVRVKFSEIVSCSLLEQEKATASTIGIRVADGAIFEVTILGGDGRFRDVFEFLRFFDRVILDAGDC